jgi:FAD/FMN-containing dehydrogenase
MSKPAPAPAQVARFRDSLAGEVVLPGDSAYDDARRVWNAVFDRQPALIVQPASASEVATAIRSGGHSALGHSTSDGGLVIDLGAMRGVTVDPARQQARANGGALLSELDAAGNAHGLVCPVGVIGHTGVAGLTLGGGIGRLQRNFGLTIDHLRSVELVTADGRQVRASRDEEPDLFWGIRGAGWNFGVVTAFEFELVPFGGTLHRGTRIHPASQAHEVWSTFRDYGPAAPDTLALIFAIGRAEPAGDFPPSIAGEPIVMVGYNHSGREEDAEADLGPLRAGPEPVVSSHASQPYLEVQTANDEAAGWGGRSYIQGLHATDLRPGDLDRLIDHAARGSGEDSFSISVQGGAIGRVPDEAMAFQGRTARFDFSADASWKDAHDDEAHRAWVREAMAIVEPSSIGSRYVNENSEDGAAAMHDIFGAPKLARLAALKRVWDPDNVFHLNFNVAP